ncbi:MAG: GatB/YqeY domain-containing protein [Chloroflexi bacterium]|nr:GatB/YqeY domain-containing protein [Chloroflexota bacterium]
MSLRDTLSDDMKAAMRGGEKLRLSTIRFLMSELKNAEISKGKALSEDEEIEVVQRQVKRRREAVEQYEKGGREELAEKEAAESVILKEYLPKQLTDEELAGIIKSAVDEPGASSRKEMGKVMGAVMPKVKGRADGARVSRIATEILPS